ncbi:MAG: hypothetical protein AB7F59_09620 [Bdellovibrionales bacterium]
MSKIKKRILATLLSLTLMAPQPSRADMWGGDVVVLVQILANAVQQLIQLRQILTTGSDTLDLLQDINRGIREGLAIIQIINPRFNPGLYGNLDTADQVLKVINDLYGRIPQTAEARLQESQDRSVAESIAMNGTLFTFADQADDESKRIIEHARVVSPQGAGKLIAQSIAILIGVSTQVLRTNSMMLKMLGESSALQNRREKLQSAQFKTQYDGLSLALGQLPKETKLQTINQGGN